ncbi:RNA-guided endonuclease InsQ/TnpB family protein [Zarconia navalis]|uniref:RNA-guided endonuclease InsQ/TnpB family protein n=1 Tax=Zarconia navalis TaxID=2992134 RepID=UPI0021F89072|nr:transposase [Zarconia navalis]
MLIYEAKLIGKPNQYNALDGAIRTGLFVRNSCIRYWMDNKGISKYDLNTYCKVLADNPEFPWARQLNSMARQAHAERAWAAVSRFFDNCKKRTAYGESHSPCRRSKKGRPGKKGYPRFKKNQRRGTVEYKTSGWKLSDDRKYITFTDGFKAGRFKMVGSRDLGYYNPKKDIKRVRAVRRADGYYVQFGVKCDRFADVEPTGRAIGLDVGLKEFYTDSNGETTPNPHNYRKSERRLKRLQRQASRKQKGSHNRRKAGSKVGRQHLKIQRQRKDHAVKLARCVVLSNDLIAYEDLAIRNLVKNRKLAKSISDTGWYQFRVWLEYFAQVFGKVTVAVPPAYTSQDCSECGKRVKKSLSTRTHVCEFGCVLDRDENAARNILIKGLRTVGHTGSKAWGDLDLCSLSEMMSQPGLGGNPHERLVNPKGIE